MTPIDTLKAWNEAKRLRAENPDDERLIRKELEAEVAHLNQVGVRIRPKKTWVSEHRALVQGVLGSLAVMALALVAYLAYETNQDQNSQGRELKVLVQSSPCSPTKEHPHQPRDAAACKRNFNQAIKSLTPEQSCYILEHGAPLVRIGGEPILRVTCIRGIEPPPKERDNKLPVPSGGAGGEHSPDQAAQTGTGAEEGGGAPSAPQNGGSGGGKGPAGGGGTQGGNPPSGGDGGGQPVEGGEGGASESPPAESSPADENPDEGNPPDEGSGGGSGSVVEGVGEVVGEAVKGACTALDRLAGLCH